MGSRQPESQELVRALGRHFPARHFKGDPVPGRWMRGGTDQRCTECEAKVGAPCRYRREGAPLDVVGFVHVRRLSSEARPVEIRAVH